MLCPRCGSTNHRITAASLTRIMGLLVQKIQATCLACHKGFSMKVVAQSKSELAEKGVTF